MSRLLHAIAYIVRGMADVAKLHLATYAFSLGAILMTWATAAQLGLPRHEARRRLDDGQLLKRMWQAKLKGELWP